MLAQKLYQLMQAYSSSLRLYAAQWCDAPEDAVQLAFCKLAAQTAWPEDPKAWLFKVVRNAALDSGKAERRRKNREQVAAKPVRWFQEADIDGLDATSAVQALQQLPEDQREVIVARLWSDLTFQQISELMVCSVSTTHRRYEAGLATLRRLLGVSCQTM